jgi:hypothetical protein
MTNTYQNPTANLIFNGEKLVAFPVRSRTKQRCPDSDSSKHHTASPT